MKRENIEKVVLACAGISVARPLGENCFTALYCMAAQATAWTWWAVP